jgi:hypothetical protein
MFAAKILKKVVLPGLHPKGISFRATFGEHFENLKWSGCWHKVLPVLSL